MALTYDQALDQFDTLFNGRDIRTVTRIYETGIYPIEAYRIFNTKEAAELLAAGDNGDYDVYPGAVVSVVDDPSSANNGLYHVEYVSTNPIQYQLVKILSENDAVSGEVKVIEKTSSDVTNPCIYFVGVDSSTTPQDTSTFYFNHGIVYDAVGNTVVSESDIRLKDVISNLDVDVDSLLNHGLDL